MGWSQVLSWGLLLWAWDLACEVRVWEWILRRSRNLVLRVLAQSFACQVFKCSSWESRSHQLSGRCCSRVRAARERLLDSHLFRSSHTDYCQVSCSWLLCESWSVSTVRRHWWALEQRSTHLPGKRWGISMWDASSGNACLESSLDLPQAL